MFFPEVSTKPPSPEIKPPLALIEPSKVVSPSDQTITLPPSPFSRASAEIEPETTVFCALERFSFLP